MRLRAIGGRCERMEQDWRQVGEGGSPFKLIHKLLVLKILNLRTLRENVISFVDEHLSIQKTLTRLEIFDML